MSYAAQNIIAPKGMDRVIFALAERLRTSVTWLDNVYGQAELIQGREDNARSRIFASFAGTGPAAGYEYVAVMPDPRLGNFAFFRVGRHRFEGRATGQDSALSRETADLSLVAFWDYQKTYPADWERRTVRHVEAELLAALTSTEEQSLVFTAEGTHTDFAEVWSGADVSSTDARLARRPFGCIRIDATVAYRPALIQCYDTQNA